MTSINIQVDNGTEMGKYELFDITRSQSGADVCNISVSEALNDCSDSSASTGINQYRIYAEYSGGSTFTEDITANTLDKNRTFRFFPIGIICVTFITSNSDAYHMDA